LIGFPVRIGAVLLLGVIAWLASAPQAPADSGRISQVSVEIRNMRVEKAGEVFRFTHDRAFVEHGGVGVMLTQAQVCFSSGRCIGQPVNYRIEPNGELVNPDAVVEPVGANETFAYRYTGEDDNGRSVLVQYEIRVAGERYEVKP
jgi:hypothetical protein